MELRLPATLVIIAIGITIAKPCNENGCDQQKLGISKCCSAGQSFHKENVTCVESTDKFDPIVRDDSGKRTNSDMFLFKYGINDCLMENYIQFLASVYLGEYYVRTDGELVITSPYLKMSPMLVSPDKYCIDNIVMENETRFNALICLKNSEEESGNNTNYLLTATCMLVSCVFILLTLIVYLSLPQLYTVHGRILVVYLVCLFVGFLILATMQLVVYKGNPTAEFCLVMTFILYFALLSAFCWLNVMCYDIWRVFSGKRELRRNKRSVRSQLYRYAIYSFGVPTILTALVICLEFGAVPDSTWLPNIRLSGCFMDGNSRLLYLYGPLLIQCVTNISFFILTTVKIVRIRNDTSILNSTESSRNDRQNNKQTLILHVKLFVIMGIGWILEIISSVWKNKHWIISDIYNIFIGLFIFIIFVCKRDTFKALKKRYKGAGQSTVSQTEKSRTTETSKS